MLKQVVAEHKERTVLELIIIGVLITLLMANFLYAFFKQESSIEEAGFRALANRFTTKVNAIHGQWLMDGRPQVIELRDNLGQTNKVKVNQFGWPDGINCEAIWQLVLDMPLELLNQPISVLELNTQSVAVENNDNLSIDKVCRYYFTQGQYFDYQRHSGKVLL
ncbi:hypothetical protein [Thalassotalea montiporae]